MENKDIWKQNYSNILVSVKFLGIYWELWQETYCFGETQSEFFQNIKQKYIKKFGKRPFKMRLYYPDMVYDIQNKH